MEGGGPRCFRGMQPPLAVPLELVEAWPLRTCWTGPEPGWLITCRCDPTQV